MWIAFNLFNNRYHGGLLLEIHEHLNYTIGVARSSLWRGWYSCFVFGKFWVQTSAQVPAIVTKISVVFL
jgi:hypothetical protein